MSCVRLSRSRDQKPGRTGHQERPAPAWRGGCRMAAEILGRLPLLQRQQTCSQASCSTPVQSLPLQGRRYLPLVRQCLALRCRL